MSLPMTLPASRAKSPVKRCFFEISVSVSGVAKQYRVLVELIVLLLIGVHTAAVSAPHPRVCACSAFSRRTGAAELGRQFCTWRKGKVLRMRPRESGKSTAKNAACWRRRAITFWENGLGAGIEFWHKSPHVAQ